MSEPERFDGIVERARPERSGPHPRGPPMAPERPNRLKSLCALVFGARARPNDSRGGCGPLWFQLNLYRIPFAVVRGPQSPYKTFCYDRPNLQSSSTNQTDDP